jgi:hypothetical protein
MDPDAHTLFEYLTATKELHQLGLEVAAFLEDPTSLENIIRSYRTSSGKKPTSLDFIQDILQYGWRRPLFDNLVNKMLESVVRKPSLNVIVLC